MFQIRFKTLRRVVVAYLTASLCCFPNQMLFPKKVDEARVKLFIQIFVPLYNKVDVDFLLFETLNF